jgi:hypothetical protein
MWSVIWSITIIFKIVNNIDKYHKYPVGKQKSGRPGKATALLLFRVCMQICQIGLDTGVAVVE